MSATPPDDRTILALGRGSSHGGHALGEGAMLNGIYRVVRPLARGGMGQVFEGINIETEERVAIKVIHKHLASDPKVQAMFRKEARILTQLAHPAIVQYRVLARDPVHDLTYIVTDLVVGNPLSDRLDRTCATVGQVVALARRLAQGLAVAHDHGAVHRDISPDNILLPEGRIEQAKIIDFGIARSLAMGAETVVGEGFAGKIGYVAPEQFGDFGRDIGPWTDIYSTGLVLLAFAAGQAPDMGSSLSEAVERRRSKLDLSLAPPLMVPLLGRMLTPDPSKRLRTMARVLEDLDGLEQRLNTAPTKTRTFFTRTAVVQTAEDEDEAAAPPPEHAAAVSPEKPDISPAANAVTLTRIDEQKRRSRLIGRLALGVLATAGLTIGWRWVTAPRTFPQGGAAPGGAITAPRARLVPTAPSASPCSWLDWSLESSGDRLRVSGVAADLDAVAAHVPSAPVVDTQAVRLLDPGRCQIVDALRALRPPPAERTVSLTASQPQFEISRDRPGCPGGLWAQTVVTIAASRPEGHFILLGLTPSGALREISTGPDHLAALARTRPSQVTALGKGGYRLSLCERQTGLVGLALIEAGDQPDIGLQGRRDAPVTQQILERLRAGKAQGWTSQMVWFDVRDAEPDAAPAAVTRSAVARPTSRSLAPPPRPAAETKDWAACRRYTGQWREMGFASLTTCATRIFATDCKVQSGQSGDIALRRYNGHVQALGGRYGDWRSIGADTCAKRR